MNKTVYLRDEEVPVWERAREISGDKISPVIVAALREYVAQKEAEAKGFERIVLRFRDADANSIPKAKAFNGRWVFPPDSPLIPDDYINQAFLECVAVAVTAKGAVVFYSWIHDSASSGSYRFKVYESLERAAADPRLDWAVNRTIEKIGVPVEQLDI